MSTSPKVWEVPPAWTLLPSLPPLVEGLAPTFTQPSAVTACHLLRAWVMCLGRQTLRRVAENAHPDRAPDHSRRHGLDTAYNFFERSAWTPKGLTYHVGVLMLTRLKLWGVITLLVDDTLAHKRGKSVWGLGWFRDAVASTKKRPKLPAAKAAAVKADRKRTTAGDWVWQDVEVAVYGCARSLKALAYEVVWPTVLGYRVIRVVVVRDPSGRMRDCYLFTTDLKASLSWVITMFAWRWAIEVVFRASKQVLDLEAPQHWSQGSVEKLAPWVWSMQSVIMVWYLTAGYHTAEAEELRGLMGDWESEWSLRHMIQVLRRAILNATIDPNSANEAELREMAKTL